MNKVQIIIEAANRTDAALREFETNTKSILAKIKEHWFGITTAVASAYATYQKISGTVTATQTLATETHRLQRITGETAEKASEMIAVADQVGVSFGALETSVANITRRMGGLKGIEDVIIDASGKTIDVFEKFGIQIKNNDGSLRPFSDILNQIRGRIRSASSETERMAIATQFFRGNAIELMPLLTMSATQYKELAEDARKYGIILTQDNVNAVRQYTFAHRDLDDALLGLKLTIGNELIPTLTEAIKQLNSGIKATNDFIKENKTLLSLPFEVLKEVKSDFEAIKLAVIAIVAVRFGPTVAGWIANLLGFRIVLTLTLAQIQALTAAFGILAGYEIGKVIDELAYSLAGIDISGTQRLNETLRETAEQTEYVAGRQEKYNKLLAQLGFIGPNAMKEFNEAVKAGQIIWDKAKNTWEKVPEKAKPAGLSDEAKKLAEEWKKAKLAMEIDVEKLGWDEFTQQIIDLKGKAKELIDHFAKIPGAKKKIEDWFGSMVGGVTKGRGAKEYAEYMSQQADIYEKAREFEKSITEAKASEVNKRLLEVDNWAEKENKILLSLWGKTITDLKQFEDLKTEITKTAGEERKKIIEANQNAIHEATISYQLSLIDIAEKEWTITKGDATRDRIKYNKELLKIQEEYLATIDKAKDTTAWYAQMNAITATRSKLLDLNETLKERFGTLTQGMKDGWRDFIDNLKTDWQNGFELIKTGLDSLQSTISSISLDAMKGKFKDWHDYVNMLLDSIRKKLADMLSQWLLFGEVGGHGGAKGAGGLMGFFSSLFGGMGNEVCALPGGTIAQYAIHEGGYIPRFHFGGLSSDEIPAILQRGEYVVSRKGVDALDRINRGNISQPNERQSPPVIVYMTVNATDADSFRGQLWKVKQDVAAIMMSVVPDNHPIRRMR